MIDKQIEEAQTESEAYKRGELDVPDYMKLTIKIRVKEILDGN